MVQDSGDNAEDVTDCPIPISLTTEWKFVTLGFLPNWKKTVNTMSLNDSPDLQVYELKFQTSLWQEINKQSL